MNRLAFIAAIMLPLPALAQDTNYLDLTMPDFSVRAEEDSVVRGCKVPGRPEWLVNVPARETYRTTLIRLLHDRIWISEVENAAECTCDTRWPTWERTLEVYFLAYNSLSIDTQQKIAQELNSQTSPRRQAANAKCHEAGL